MTGLEQVFAHRGVTAELPASLRPQIIGAHRRLPAARVCAIHGDLNRSNVLMTRTGPVLLDWDEARLNHPAYDLPLVNAIAPIRRAHEILSGWSTEPRYARRLASALRRGA